MTYGERYALQRLLDQTAAVYEKLKRPWRGGTDYVLLRKRDATILLKDGSFGEDISEAFAVYPEFDPADILKDLRLTVASFEDARQVLMGAVWARMEKTRGTLADAARSLTIPTKPPTHH